MSFGLRFVRLCWRISLLMSECWFFLIVLIVLCFFFWVAKNYFCFFLLLDGRVVGWFEALFFVS